MKNISNYPSIRFRQLVGGGADENGKLHEKLFARLRLAKKEFPNFLPVLEALETVKTATNR